MNTILALALSIGLSGGAGSLGSPAGAGLGLFPVDQIGGATLAVAVQGNLAYVGTGPRLTVWDLADPARPIQRGQSELLAGLVTTILIDRGHAWVLCRSTDASSFSVQALDLADPARPRAVGALALAGTPMDLAAAGGWLWVAAGGGGTLIVDARQPSRPRLAVKRPDPAFALEIQGTRAFVLERARLLVWDATDPSQATPLGGQHIGGNGLGVIGSHLVVVNGFAQVVDVMAIEPVEGAAGGEVVLRWLARLPLAIAPGAAMAVAGNLAFVAGTAAVHVLDLGDPTKPVTLSQVRPALATVTGVAASGTRLWLAAGEAGLWVYDVADPMAPRLVAARPDLTQVRDAVAVGDRLYVAAGSGGLWVLDLADRGRPRPLGWLALPDAQAIVVQAPLAYVACGRAGVFVVDVGNPAHPVARSLFKVPDEATDLVVAGGMAYVAGGRSGLRITDVRDPAQPRFVNAVEDLGDEPMALALADHLFIAARRAGLRIFSLADPAAPLALARYDTPDDAMALAAGEGRVYVGYAPGGLRAFDVHDPTRPGIEDYFPIGPVLGLTGVGDHVIAAVGAAGIRPVGWDTAGRLAPAGIAGPVAGFAQAAAVTDDGYVYAAAGDHGLYVLAPRPTSSVWLPRLERR